MPQTSIQELLAEMEATVAEWRELLAQHLDFAGLEQAITARMNALGAELVKQVVEPLLPSRLVILVSSSRQCPALLPHYLKRLLPSFPVMYTLRLMATLQKKTSRGRTYWQMGAIPRNDAFFPRKWHHSLT